MYQNAQQNETANNQGSSADQDSQKDGEVKDADYEVVDDEKK